MVTSDYSIIPITTILRRQLFDEAELYYFIDITVPFSFFLSIFENCDSNFGLFSIVACKVITLKCIFLSTISLLLFLISLYIDIARPTINRDICRSFSFFSFTFRYRLKNLNTEKRL